MSATAGRVYGKMFPQHLNGFVKNAVVFSVAVQQDQRTAMALGFIIQADVFQLKEHRLSP